MSTTTTRITAGLLALGTAGALALGTASAASAAPAPAATAAPAGSPITGSVTIDPVAISQAIADAAKTAQNRDGFVKNLSYDAFYNLGGQQYNAMVMNLSQPHDPSGLQGVLGYASGQYDGITYGIWIFEGGTFVNQGDGGYINWAFFGQFTRDGGSVTFS